MSPKPTCIVCSNELEPINNIDLPQPYGGLVFTSHGNYGSRVFDHMGGCLQIIVCDPCFLDAAANGLVTEYAMKQHPAEVQYVRLFDPTRSPS